MKERRNEYDVSNAVRVSDPEAVREAVRGLFTSVYPDASFSLAARAFHDFARLCRGQFPGYHGCETPYHDLKHTLDMSLALARLIYGYERSHGAQESLGPERTTVGLITALYHDAGYFRHHYDVRHHHGAEYTPTHVSRSARFLAEYLPILGLADQVAVARRMVHFTGYEQNINRIEIDDPKYTLIGHMIGTADLIAQMADRCYLEKCRDHLYREFTLSGSSSEQSSHGWTSNFSSPRELLEKTPEFYARTFEERLDGTFGGIYHLAACSFNGTNLYIEEMQRNLRHLEHIVSTGDWSLLRRNPSCFLAADYNALAAPWPI